MPKLADFHSGDRIALVRYFGFGPLPQGEVVAVGARHVHCKMDRHGRVVRLAPGDLRIIDSPKQKRR